MGWDCCSISCLDSIEKLQNEAARIATGLPRSVSLENLYKECGWETLPYILEEKILSSALCIKCQTILFLIT